MRYATSESQVAKADRARLLDLMKADFGEAAPAESVERDQPQSIPLFDARGPDGVLGWAEPPARRAEPGRSSGRSGREVADESIEQNLTLAHHAVDRRVVDAYTQEYAAILQRHNDAPLACSAAAAHAAEPSSKTRRFNRTALLRGQVGPREPFAQHVNAPAGERPDHVAHGSDEAGACAWGEGPEVKYSVLRKLRAATPREDLAVRLPAERGVTPCLAWMPGGLSDRVRRRAMPDVGNLHKRKSVTP